MGDNILIAENNHAKDLDLSILLPRSNEKRKQTQQTDISGLPELFNLSTTLRICSLCIANKGFQDLLISSLSVATLSKSIQHWRDILNTQLKSVIL